MTNTVLGNDELKLIPIALEDTDDIVRWRNADHVRRNFLYQDLLTIGDHLKWYEEKVLTGTVSQFRMVPVYKENLPGDPKDDAYKKGIGSVYLRDIDMEKKIAEYGIFIGEEDYLGFGFGSLACRMICEYSRDTLGLKKLSLRLMEDNIPALKSYESAGFIKTNRTENIYSGIEGKEKKVIFMEKEL